MSLSRSHQFDRRGRGFTILEIMVTIGILVLIAAGVSVIFSSVAETVNTGKRVAELNRYAAQFERVMRQDFENMTRDGYLVLVHQVTNDGDVNDLRSIDTKLSPADHSDLNQGSPSDTGPGHPRRVDEIMFFARGEFETSRRAISAGLVAKSSEAAIYYGHGQKRRLDIGHRYDNPGSDTGANPNLFFNPSTRDTNIKYNYVGNKNQAALGFRSTDGGLNPNQYARDWSLLRHVTVLANPESSGQDLPDELFNATRTGPGRQWLEDSDRQIALQPAGRSIFNSLAQSGFETFPVPPEGYTLPKWFGQYPGSTTGPTLEPLEYIDPMLRASGLVDIVTDDLVSIRTVLYGLSGAALSAPDYDNPMDYWDRSRLNRIAKPMSLSYDEFSSLFWEDPSASPTISDAENVTLPRNGVATDEFTNVRQWMIDSLPSLWDLRNVDQPVQLSRVRYEDIPTRLLYEEGAFGAPDNDNSKRLRTYAEANQEMLGSSVFIPQCTEFIVEWSFGFTDPRITDPFDPRYKKMRWHGLDRWIDANGDGIIDTSGNGIDLGEDQIVAKSYSKRVAVPAIPDLDLGPDPQLLIGHLADFGGFGPPRTTEITTFGYPDSNGTDWPWPKFIRVTVTIADANDLSLEHTFQMVFGVPGV